MKKILYLILYSMISVSAAAQSSQWSKMIGSRFFYYKTGTTTETSRIPPRLVSNVSTFHISPYFSGFAHEHFMYGIGLDYLHEKTFSQKSSGEQDIIQAHLYGLNVFMRRYYAVSEKFEIYAQILIGFDKGNANEVNDYATRILTLSKLKLANFQAVASLGLSYKVSKKIRAELNYGSFGLTSLASKYTYKLSGNPNGKKDVVTNLGLDFDTSTFCLGINYAF